MAGAAVARHELVHDAAASANEFVFGLLAQARKLHAVDGVTRNFEQCKRGCYFNRRRGT